MASVAADCAAGGPRLRATRPSEELFAAVAMQVLVKRDLMSMKVTELKELEARGRETETGNKAWLRRRCTLQLCAHTCRGL